MQDCYLEAADAAGKIVCGEIEQAMNEFNKKKKE